MKSDHELHETPRAAFCKRRFSLSDVKSQLRDTDWSVYKKYWPNGCCELDCRHTPGNDICRYGCQVNVLKETGVVIDQLKLGVRKRNRPWKQQICSCGARLKTYVVKSYKDSYDSGRTASTIKNPSTGDSITVVRDSSTRI